MSILDRHSKNTHQNTRHEYEVKNRLHLNNRDLTED